MFVHLADVDFFYNSTSKISGQYEGALNTYLNEFHKPKPSCHTVIFHIIAILSLPHFAVGEKVRVQGTFNFA